MLSVSNLLFKLFMTYNLVLFGSLGLFHYDKSYFLQGTYITKIEGSREFTRNVYNSLDKFNEISDNKAIQWSGYRPIFIYEDVLEGGILGQAQYNPYGCIITLSRDLHSAQLEDTLLHEIMHCYYVSHVDVYCDIMYASASYCGFLTYLSKLHYLSVLGILNER